MVQINPITINYTYNPYAIDPNEMISSNILSDVIVHMKYARYLPEKKRRENWEELITRNMQMHLEKYPELKDEIEEVYRFVYAKKILPSMRSLQFAGKPIEINPARIYNCSYLPIDDIRAFSEILFLLLSGTGVGFSTQKHHISKLPLIVGPLKETDGRKRKKRFLIADSIEGWADSVKVLMESYFKGERELEFDYRDIRPKGSQLITSGGKAPGPQPLKDCIHSIRKVLDTALEERGVGTKLKPIEAHDIACHIADAVLSGGIRRAAMISLFSFDDNEMLTAKFGNWWEDNPQRGRANNSVVLLRHRVTQEDFFELWEKIRLSNSGEPGFFFTNDKEIMTNPCSEISLRPFQFCNLVEMNVSNIESQEDLNERSKAAAFIATLQAGYTDFHYLRDIWKDTTEKEALIGVSGTGIASGKFTELDIKTAALIVKKENERVSKIIGINKAARCTTVKPSGTASLVLGTSSGIHAWHNDYYIRRVRVGKNEPIYRYLSIMHPELIEDEFFKPDLQAIISVPQKAPEGATLRHETAISLLERLKKISTDWIVPGHRKGANKNNVSVTVSLKEKEWEEAGKWMWENRELYTAISVLPYDGGSYVQAPFEDITKEQYEHLLNTLQKVDLNNVIEEEDGTDLMGELACAGGACEVK